MKQKRHQGNLSCCSTNVKVAILLQHLCQLLQQQTKSTSTAIKLHFILYFKFAGTSFTGTSHFHHMRIYKVYTIARFQSRVNDQREYKFRWGRMFKWRICPSVHQCPYYQDLKHFSRSKKNPFS